MSNFRPGVGGFAAGESGGQCGGCVGCGMRLSSECVAGPSSFEFVISLIPFLDPFRHHLFAAAWLCLFISLILCWRLHYIILYYIILHHQSFDTLLTCS